MLPRIDYDLAQRIHAERLEEATGGIGHVSSAWSAWLPGVGMWRDQTDRLHVRRIPLTNKWAIINERLKVPLEPMIGCIGLAPATGSSSTVFPAYP